MRANNQENNLSSGRIQFRFTAILTLVIVIFSVFLPSIMVLPQTAYATSVKFTLPSPFRNFVSAGGLHSLYMDDGVWASMLLGGTGVVPDKILESIADTLDPGHPSMHLPQGSPTTNPTTSPTLPASLVTKPQILGASNPNLKGPIEADGRFVKLGDGRVFLKKDLTIQWDSLYAPNYLVSVTSELGVVFWAFVGAVTTYTLPASIFTEGSKHWIAVAGTTGTDRLAPDYKEWYIHGGSNLYNGVSITIHTLKPPHFNFPANDATVPKEDLTVKWDSDDWQDSFGNFKVYYRYRLKDLTTNQTGDGFIENQQSRNSFTIPKAMLATGHTYRFGVEATIGGYNFNPDLRQASETTFTVRYLRSE